MYRDSKHGLTIDLAGPDGNALFLMGQAKRYARQMDKDVDAIVSEMMNGDYSNVLAVFEREFGTVVTLLNKPRSRP